MSKYLKITTIFALYAYCMFLMAYGEEKKGLDIQY
ncbi:hypothetical protein TcasGA2_TC034746 [Tribolium castaneum]|uniref:Uncharacterized protein n=1 Tax=Tribolium castaneum TaxID=7070 RepID=A0A139WG79_TRICA|nr:hypothetical protein TcasGA2_TC034746 [Tribolium castaneum]